MPQPSFNHQVHGICLLCQQEPCHFGSLSLPEVSSESLPSFSDSSPIHKAQLCVFTWLRVMFTGANRCYGTWTKVTGSNSGWQRAKGSGEMFQLKHPCHYTACGVAEYAEGWEMSWGWVRRISVQPSTLTEWKCLYSFMRLQLSW